MDLEDITEDPVVPEDTAEGLEAPDMAAVIITPWVVECGTGLLVTEDAAAACSL